MSKAEELAQPVAWRYKELVNNEFISDWVITKYEPPDGVRILDKEPLYAAAHLRALDASHQRLVEALEWAMARIGNKAPHQAIEGDGELYAFASSLAALEQAKALS
jgi:hypothetical protein